MAHSMEKELQDIIRRRSKCIDRNDFAEAAKLSNAAGEICASNGLYAQACRYHEEEITYSAIVDDFIGEGVGHRKVGECLCQLSDFENALRHQKKHLQIAREHKNLIEEQRALATIGRTLYLQSETLEDDGGMTLIESQKAYLESLSVCDKLKTIVSEKELLEMRSRLYLNLGLVYEWKNDLNEAVRFIKKALVTSSEYKLKETVFRCYFSLSCLYSKQNKHSEALQFARQAQKVSKELGRLLESDAWIQLGNAQLSLGNFQGVKHAFKCAHHLSPISSNSDCSSVLEALKLSVQGEKLLLDLEEASSQIEKFKIYEKLGDLYSDCRAFGLAIGCYKKQLEIGLELKVDNKTLGQIYVSLGVTYSENRAYDIAIECYRKELHLRQNEHKENAATYCAIAKAQEDSGQSFEVIKSSYESALACAKMSGTVTERKVYAEYLDTLVRNGSKKEAEKVLWKIDELKTMICSDEEEESQSDNAEEILSQENIDLLLNLDDTSEDMEENILSENVTTEHIPGKRKIGPNLQTSRKKIKKVNEKGETPLHTASIAGNWQQVNALLRKGADVNARDYCGWQPLHEAANHGHDKIVESLLLAGAKVNDPGGQHCQGVTPLHDASQNGHLSTVKLLVAHGANLKAKDAHGNTPCDFVNRAILAQREEGVEDSEILQCRRNVLQYLKTCLLDPKGVNKEFRARNLAAGDDFDLCLEPMTLDNESSGLGVDCFPTDNIETRMPANLTNRNSTESYFEALRSFDVSDESGFSSSDDEDTSMVEYRSKKSASALNLHAHYRVQHHSKDGVQTSSSSNERALVDEASFIVDDMPIRTKPFPNSSMSSKREHYARREVHLKRKNTFKATSSSRKVHDTVDVVNPEDSVNTSHSLVTVENESSIPGSLHPSGQLIRIRVKVNNNTFLIPCSGDYKIGWLSNEVLSRYGGLFSQETKEIQLYNKDGALLYCDDMISHVLGDNCEVLAKEIEEQAVCTIPDWSCEIKEIVALRHGNLEELNLKGEFLTVKDLHAMALAFSSCDCVISVIIEDCFFDRICDSSDIEKLQELMDSITKLANVECLAIRRCSLPLVTKCLSKALHAKIQSAEYTFGRLKDLDLSGMQFPSQAGVFLHALFTSSRSLMKLNLANCHIDLETAFENCSVQESFANLQGLRSINLSGNMLCSDRKNYLSNFMNALLTIRPDLIDLSNTENIELYEKEFGEKLLELLVVPDSRLSTISLSGCLPTLLKDPLFSSKFFQALTQSTNLNSLSCQFNDMGVGTAKVIAALLPSFPTLTNIVLSDLQSFDAECLLILLQSLSSQICKVKRLDCSRTKVCSPLPFYIFSLLGDCRELLLLNLNECDIFKKEKEKLLAAWQHLNPQNEGVVSEFMCFFQRL